MVDADAMSSKEVRSIGAIEVCDINGAIPMLFFAEGDNLSIHESTVRPVYIFLSKDVIGP